MARILTLPCLWNWNTPKAAVHATGVSPETTASDAGPAPLYGTCTMSDFHNTRNTFSQVRCGVVPLPGEANESLPFLASVFNSSRVFTGTLSFTEITLGWVETTTTGTKSFTAS